jgi:hypothetical protein
MSDLTNSNLLLTGIFTGIAEDCIYKSMKNETNFYKYGTMAASALPIMYISHKLSKTILGSSKTLGNNVKNMSIKRRKKNLRSLKKRRSLKK